MNALCFSFKSKNTDMFMHKKLKDTKSGKQVSRRKKDNSMGKRKGTIGLTMIYKNILHILQRKLKTTRNKN